MDCISLSRTEINHGKRYGHRKKRRNSTGFICEASAKWFIYGQVPTAKQPFLQAVPDSMYGQ